MLPEVLIVIPDLASALARALEIHGDLPGTGLKKLRSLSQGMRLAVHQAGAVQGYTLLLGDTTQQGDVKLVAFLKNCKILRLGIKLQPSAASNGDTRSNKKATSDYAAQTSAFISNIGPALLSVTTLTLTLPPVHGCNIRESVATKAATAMFLPFATACPQLQHLTVTGRIGSSFLQHFGSNCRHLASLSVILTNLSPTTLKNLPTLLPNFTNLTAVCLPRQSPGPEQLVEERETGQAVNQAALILAMKHFPTLTCLDTGSCAMTEEVWQALPPGLHSLALPFSSQLQGVTKWRAHASLCKLSLTADLVSAPRLAAILGRAPNAHACHLRHSAVVSCNLSRADALGLQIVDDRISKGLVLTGTNLLAEHNTDKRCSVTLAFRVLSRRSPRQVTDEASRGYQHPMAVFMAEHMDQPLHNFSKLKFYHRAGEGGAAADLLHLPRVFPSVVQLRVENMCLKGSDMRGLAQCPLLRRLELVTVEGVGGKPLRLLCSEHKALRSVSMHGCRGITEDEEEKIRYAGNKLSGVDVRIARGRVLEADDARLSRQRDWQDERIPDGDCDANGDWMRDDNRPSRCWIVEKTDWM